MLNFSTNAGKVTNLTQQMTRIDIDMVEDPYKPLF